MKVLVLGGGGGMGQVAAREAVGFDFVTAVTVADLDGAHAAGVAERLGPKASSLGLDVNDRAAMRAAIAAHDVVLNAAGPFYILGVSVLEQVIDVGRPYADICDDWEPTLDMLELSARAREKGVTAIVGLGASPGVTNLIALKAAHALDEVDDLITCWSIESDADEAETEETQRPNASGTSAAVVHWVQQLTGTIRVLAGGDFQDVKPLQPRTIHYPGHGDLEIWSVGHPEAVTLSRAVPGLRDCSNNMVGPAETFQGLGVVAGLVDSGAITVHEAADAIVADMRKSAGAPKKPRSSTVPGVFAWASGRRNGEAAIAVAHVRSLPAGGMGGATGVPLALALPLFKAGLGDRHGVFAPEELIDPDMFLDLLAPRCVGSFANGDELLALRVEEMVA